MSTYDELTRVAAQMQRALEGAKTVIETGDLQTRTVIPTGDRSEPTNRLLEVATLQAARAFCKARPPARGGYDTEEARDRAVEQDARALAATTEFRTAITAAVRIAVSPHG